VPTRGPALGRPTVKDDALNVPCGSAAVRVDPALAALSVFLVELATPVLSAAPPCAAQSSALGLSLLLAGSAAVLALYAEGLRT